MEFSLDNLKLVVQKELFETIEHVTNAISKEFNIPKHDIKIITLANNYDTKIEVKYKNKTYIVYVQSDPVEYKLEQDEKNDDNKD